MDRLEAFSSSRLIMPHLGFLPEDDVSSSDLNVQYLECLRYLLHLELTDREWFTLKRLTIQPAATVQQLMNNRSNILLSRKRTRQGPKTIFCHDLKNGYCESSNHYCFLYWSLIDVFIYFSHHFVAIPPVEWIYAAHHNGVPCFGTVIIEHWQKYQQREAIISGNEMLLQMIDKPEETVSKLVQLAQHFCFDGWLLNIEATLPKVEVHKMEKFVKLLCDAMHVALDGPFKEDERPIRVIWYDALTNEGKLVWQNELNEKNYNFFQLCDAIFLNYSWKEENLKRSEQLAGNRKYDVLVGIDVFGRNTIYPGGNDSYRAMQMAHQNDLSIALFAPSWTFESCNNSLFCFKTEHNFWAPLAEFGLTQYEHVPCTLPLHTNFCIGTGYRRYRHGVEVGIEWYDLRFQQLMPTFPSETKFYVLMFTMDDAFNGGSSLLLRLHQFPQPEPIPIFRCHIPLDLPPESDLLKLIVVYKLKHHSEGWLKSFHLEAIIDFVTKPNSEMKAFSLTSDGAASVKSEQTVDNALELIHLESISMGQQWTCQQWIFRLPIDTYSLVIAALKLLPSFKTPDCLEHSVDLYLGEVLLDYARYNAERPANLLSLPEMFKVVKIKN